jgi:hypothetical protein
LFVAVIEFLPHALQVHQLLFHLEDEGLLSPYLLPLRLISFLAFEVGRVLAKQDTLKFGAFSCDVFLVLKRLQVVDLLHSLLGYETHLLLEI